MSLFQHCRLIDMLARYQIQQYTPPFPFLWIRRIDKQKLLHRVIKYIRSLLTARRNIFRCIMAIIMLKKESISILIKYKIIRLQFVFWIKISVIRSQIMNTFNYLKGSSAIKFLVQFLYIVLKICHKFHHNQKIRLIILIYVWVNRVNFLSFFQIIENRVNKFY